MEAAMRGLIGAALLVAGAPLAAQDQAPAASCAAPLVAPAPWAGWSNPAPLVVAEKPGAQPFATFVPGRAVSVTLARARDVVFAVPPAKPVTATSYGGMVMLTVPAAGTYRVAIGAAAWIDMVSGGQSIASVAHSHGAPCSGIVKMVDFVLPAGTATIELSGAPTPVTTAMVVRVS
jgi:hypothetical protein